MIAILLQLETALRLSVFNERQFLCAYAKFAFACHLEIPRTDGYFWNVACNIYDYYSKQAIIFCMMYYTSTLGFRLSVLTKDVVA